MATTQTQQTTQQQGQQPTQGGAMTKAASTTAAKGRPLKDTLAAYVPQIVDALPATLGTDMRKRVAERMVKVALSATGRNADLAKCTQSSIVKAVLLSAELGLEAGGMLGEAYLVPFNNSYQVDGKWVKVKEATLITGYRGLIKLARQSGEVSSVVAQVVYENDFYDVDLGLHPRVTHKPNLVSDRGPMLFAYAGIVFKDGGEQLDVMTRSDIEKIKGRSRASSKGPWVTDPAEMWRKTVVRRLMKYAPLSSDRMARAQEHDDEVDGALDGGAIVASIVETGAEDAQQPEQRSSARSANLAGKIQANAAQAARGQAQDMPEDDFIPDDDQGEPPLDDSDSPDAPPPEQTKAQAPAAAPAEPKAKEGQARDGSDGSVPADQEPPLEALADQTPPKGAGDAWEPPAPAGGKKSKG